MMWRVAWKQSLTAYNKVGEARSGGVWWCMASWGWVWSGKAWLAWRGTEWHGGVRWGVDRCGAARQGWHGLEWQCTARLRTVR